MLFALVVAIGAIPGMAIAKMDPPKTNVSPPNRLPFGFTCSPDMGNQKCIGPDGSLWTCGSNPDGTADKNNCTCLSGCKKPQPYPSPTPK